MRSAHVAYLLLATTLPAAAQHTQHAEHAPPSPAAAASVSDADRAAAFPDLLTRASSNAVCGVHDSSVTTAPELPTSSSI